MSDFRQRNILLRTFVCVVIVCIVYGAEVKIEHDVMKAVQRIQEFTDANTKSQYQRPISTLFQDSHSDVIARAEELLQNGIQDSKLNVTSTCQNHTEMFLSALAGGQQWALRMIDAIGKPPSDILDYKYVWLGSYDECVAIEAAVNISGVITSPFKGRYCKAYFKLGETQPSPFNPTGEVDLTVGVCVPNSCNGEDTVHLLNISMFNRTILPAPTHVECQYESLEYTPKAIVVMVICSIFGLVLIVATLYDIVMIQWLGNRSKEMKHYEILKENYEPLANSRTGNSYGATDSATPLPVNAHDITVNNQADANIGSKKQGEYQQPGKLARILLSFSVYTNASKILTVNQPPGTLTAVHGIRFISMTWVILGHTYVFGITTGDNLLPFATKMMKRFTFQAILNGLLSVDTFFTLSGLLVAYLSLKEMKKRTGALKFRWGMFYFHRFWRLTPPYMLFMMFYIPLIKYWSNGPLWSQQGVEVNECEDTWWKNLLYVNNLVDPAHMCMGWAWYLANDMQFFIVSPLMLIPLFYSPLLGGLSCGVFVLVNFISTGVISARDHLGPGFLSNTNGFIDIYIKPWCRIGPYAVGCLAGYILYKTECKIRIPKIVNLFGWAVATAVALLTVYGLYDSSGQPHLSNGVSAFYNATHRTAWALAVSWVIIACATGNGGWVNTFLSWKPFIPLSRLTYCAYLVHPVVMEVYYMSRRTLVYYTDMEVSYLFCGHLCLSYAVAFLVSLAFESPMMGLEKVLLGREKNS